jgi:Domain of unknown function (DUF6894)
MTVLGATTIIALKPYNYFSHFLVLEHGRQLSRRYSGGDGMPQYFFQFYDGKRQFTDTAGVELTAFAAARAHARVQVRDLRAALSEPSIQERAGWKMVVVGATAVPLS